CAGFLARDDTPPVGRYEPAAPALVGKYEVRGELGRGGMGVVYRVWDPLLRREAALKMLRPSGLSLLPDEAAHLARRFQQEAQVPPRVKDRPNRAGFAAGGGNRAPHFDFAR